MILTEDNLELFAAKCYINNNCIDIEEFKEDFNRLKYIKRLVKRYEVYGELRERLILNHLVIMYNVFENKDCTRMIFYKLRLSLPVIIPFLLLLKRLPKEVYNHDNKIIHTSDILMDQEVIKKLRDI
tara:strand:- start:500 stop:880 length:381 start_codon:yes stop_codon:yes gene_type:complete